jgi:hypothetical protein
VKRTLVIAGAIVIGALALNATGLVRYPGGPLREQSADGILWLDTRPADQGSNTVGNTPDADWATTDTDLMVSSPWLRNPWPRAVTVHAITPIDVSGGIVVSEVLLGRADAEAEKLVWEYGPVTADQRAILDRDYAPRAAVMESGESNRNVALVVRASEPGPARFEALEIDYRIGPFTFRVVHHSALHGCLGMTAEERFCPDDD